MSALPQGTAITGVYVAESGITASDSSITSIGTPPADWSGTDSPAFNGNQYDILALYSYEHISNSNKYVVLAMTRSNGSNSASADLTGNFNTQFLRIYGHPGVFHLPLQCNNIGDQYTGVLNNTGHNRRTFTSGHSPARTGLMFQWCLASNSGNLGTFSFRSGGSNLAMSFVTGINVPW